MTDLITIVIGLVLGLGFYIIPGLILYAVINWLSEVIYGKC